MFDCTSIDRLWKIMTRFFICTTTFRLWQIIKRLFNCTTITRHCQTLKRPFNRTTITRLWNDFSFALLWWLTHSKTNFYLHYHCEIFTNFWKTFDWHFCYSTWLMYNNFLFALLLLDLKRLFICTTINRLWQILKRLFNYITISRLWQILKRLLICTTINRLC